MKRYIYKLLQFGEFIRCLDTLRTLPLKYNNGKFVAALVKMWHEQLMFYTIWKLYHTSDFQPLICFVLCLSTRDYCLSNSVHLLAADLPTIITILSPVQFHYYYLLLLLLSSFTIITCYYYCQLSHFATVTFHYSRLLLQWPRLLPSLVTNTTHWSPPLPMSVVPTISTATNVTSPPSLPLPMSHAMTIIIVTVITGVITVAIITIVTCHNVNSVDIVTLHHCPSII